MASATVRVVPPFNPRGLTALGAAAGLLYGAELAFLLEHLSKTSLAVSAGRVVNTVVPVFLFTVPPFLAVVALSRRTQRPMPLLLFSLAVTISLPFSVWTCAVFASPTAGLQIWTSTFWASLSALFLLIPLTVAAISGALFTSLARTLVRSFLCTLAEQTGTLCWACGYDLGGPAISTCPECGTSADPARFHAARLIHAIDALRSKGRLLLFLIVVVLGAWAGYRIVTIAYPLHRFFAAMDHAGTPHTSWLYVAPGAAPSGRWQESAVAIPVETDPTRIWLVQYFPSGPPGVPGRVRARITLGALPRPLIFGPTTVTWPDEGSIRIYSDLNAAQAESLIQSRHIPDALTRELLRTAADKQWTPTTGPATGPTLLPESPVNPSEYFP